MLSAVGKREPCGVCNFLCGLYKLAPAFLCNFDNALGTVCGRNAVDSCYLVEQAPVNFVPDAREHRNGVVRYRTAERFAVKIVQVRFRAAPAHNAHDVNFVVVTQGFKCIEHACFCRIPLHGGKYGHDPELEGRGIEPCSKILVGRGVFAGNEPDAQRHQGQGEQLVLFEQAFAGKPLQYGHAREGEFPECIDRVDVEDLCLQFSARDINFGFNLETDLELFLDDERGCRIFSFCAEGCKLAGEAGEVYGRDGLDVSFFEICDADIDALALFRESRDYPVHPNCRRFGKLVPDRGHVLHDRECAYGLVHGGTIANFQECCFFCPF